ncbi:vigilin [Lates japonicus]|uniref:Vigilin n=1 Tax=Lates japonicus TaxID=270547 RepID=A0AAD3NDC9_LATJO|nr:vigilin [Lates japonicus]
MSSVAVLTPEAGHTAVASGPGDLWLVPEMRPTSPPRAFPLRRKEAPGEGRSPASGVGSRSGPVASVITQVFTCPWRSVATSSGGEEAKVCLDIMQRTGAHIELCPG